MSHKGYELYIDGLLMPIAPMEYKVKINNKNRVVSLLNGNDLNLIKGAGLSEISTKIRLPSEDFPSVMNYQPQSIFLDKFESLKSNDDKKKVVSFVLLREYPNRSIEPIKFEMVTLEEYEFDEDARSAMDLIVTLKFKQYIPPPSSKLEVPKNNTETSGTKVIVKNERPSSREKVNNAKVEDETLLEFSKKHTGSFNNAEEIARKNKISNWNGLVHGENLRL